jgi:hypothetical protein
MQYRLAAFRVNRLPAPCCSKPIRCLRADFCAVFGNPGRVGMQKRERMFYGAEGSALNIVSYQVLKSGPKLNGHSV